MLIHLPTLDSQSLTLRGRLLDRALRAHLLRRGDRLLPPVPRRTGPQAVADTATLAALPPRPHAPQVASLGLGLPEALRHGPATLLLTQPLCAELETFVGPGAWEAAGTLPLVLQAYARAIVTDRADVAGSVGFAPWLPLALADGFPVDAPQPSTTPDRRACILILDHGAPPARPRCCAAPFRHRACRCTASLRAVPPQTPPQAPICTCIWAMAQTVR